jgi:hypothetical protein
VLDPEILVIHWSPYRARPARSFRKQPYERILKNTLSLNAKLHWQAKPLLGATKNHIMTDSHRPKAVAGFYGRQIANFPSAPTEQRLNC